MCAPFFLSKGKIPKKLPKEMEEEAKILSKCKSKIECLKKAYDFIRKNFKAKKYQFFPKFFRMFVKDINKLWAYSKTDKFIHCMQQNYLFRVLLIKSGQFKEKDIGLIDFIHVKFNPHQILTVNVGDKWIRVDVWFSHLGVPFGENFPILFRIWPTIF